MTWGEDVEPGQPLIAMSCVGGRFAQLVSTIGQQFRLHGRFVDTQRWQAQDVSERPEMTPFELACVSLAMDIFDFIEHVQVVIQPNLPWAEDHFQERVSGQPLNPPPSHEWWPFNRRKNAEHVDENERFSHTYPERFWPKQAADKDCHFCDGLDEQDIRPHPHLSMKGIRFKYGDLSDVVKMLLNDPHTRQAYLPVFFPEDTGKQEVRIPCTIGYQFMIRDSQMHVIYTIRSCDFLRHFRDDVYMAMRLGQWVLDSMRLVDPKYHEVKMGTLKMDIGSFHVFQGDLPRMKKEYGE